jgi:transcriptional regulator with XRE-family HTH domain
MNYFAKNIEYLREELSLTKAAMLDRLDIPRTTWASYENNDAEPSIDRLITIAGFFGADVTELLTIDMSKQDRKKLPASARKSKGKTAYKPVEDAETSIVNENEGYSKAPCKECRGKDSIIEAQAITIKALQSALHQAEERLKEKAPAIKKRPGSPF